MQLPPSIELAGFIRHYLFLDLPAAGNRKLRLFPDGSTGIVLNSFPNLLWDSTLLPAAFFYGQTTEYKELASTGAAQMAVVVFQPNGINRLLNIPASELNDQVVALDLLFGPAARVLEEALAVTGDIPGKLGVIEDFFRKMVAHRSFSTDVLVSGALDLIQQHQGTLSIHQLIRLMGCPARQLERKFGISVGVSPKQYSKIVRTLHFVKFLQGQAISLTAAAYACGFYDQAHGIREFRKATGLTPSKYLKSANPLALNFLVL